MPVIEELVSERTLVPGKKDGIWFSSLKMPQRDVSIRAAGERFMLVNESGRTIGELGGTLHAVEHTAIACMPLFVLCDRGDIGGLSHTGFPDFGLPAIFMYDGHEGGVGLTRRVLDVIPEWLEATLRIIEDCPCESGCPSCVQDAQCGNRNQPLDKQGAKFLLKRWLEV